MNLLLSPDHVHCNFYCVVDPVMDLQEMTSSFLTHRVRQDCLEICGLLENRIFSK